MFKSAGSGRVLFRAVYYGRVLWRLTTNTGVAKFRNIIVVIIEQFGRDAIHKWAIDTNMEQQHVLISKNNRK